MNLRTIILVAIAVLAILLLANSVYTVHETERAVLLRFGAVENDNVAPGLHFKWPIAEQVKVTDGRILTLDAPAERYFTLEKQPLIVDSYAKWRVEDVATYYKATSFDTARAERLLQARVNEGLRNQIGRRDMHEVVSGERDDLVLELTERLDRVMESEFGISVVDVRVKRIELPAEVSTAVYERMISERQIEANQYRATGRELAAGIEADADRQTVVIAAEAYRQAELLRGDGDARAAEIYAEAYTRNPEFYQFYRSVNAYAEVFSDKGDLLVIDPSSEFFRYLRRTEPEAE